MRSGRDSNSDLRGVRGVCYDFAILAPVICCTKMKSLTKIKKIDSRKTKQNILALMDLVDFVSILCFGILRF